MLSVYAPDAEVVDRRRVGFGSFSGLGELRGLYSGIVSSAASFHEDVDVRAAGSGLVVAHCEVRARLATDPTGPEIGAEYGFVVTVRDGQIARLELFDDGEQALAASGLRATAD
jgi:hypothetical protein